MDEDVNRILAYWFVNSRDDLNYAIKRWFSGSKKVDAEIRERFSQLVNAARASQLTRLGPRSLKAL
ncbi:hypothetical protein B0O99DRAFT_299212 [Bisporella sp. PMI_857]|nr:hypothetical protein B0O99DRAFT_299212 [Bisporella sp. PMI_857]